MSAFGIQFHIFTIIEISIGCVSCMPRVDTENEKRNRILFKDVQFAELLKIKIFAVSIIHNKLQIQCRN